MIVSIAWNYSVTKLKCNKNNNHNNSRTVKTIMNMCRPTAMTWLKSYQQVSFAVSKNEAYH